MAREAARRASRSQLSIVNLRRKTTEKSVEVGSVGVHGQRLTIRVEVDEYLPLQHCYKYKYEVVSPKSPYRGERRHHFLIRTNVSGPHLLRAVQRESEEPYGAQGESISSQKT